MDTNVDPKKLVIIGIARAKLQTEAIRVAEQLTRLENEFSEQIKDTGKREPIGPVVEGYDAKKATLKERQNDIEKALRRCEDGTYGMCINCHGLIPPERLDTFPTASRCLPCQGAHKTIIQPCSRHLPAYDPQRQKMERVGHAVSTRVM